MRESFLFDRCSTLSLVTLEGKDGYESPVDFIIVVDVSGSMAGERIQTVRDSLLKATKLFTDTDRVAVVIFDDRVDHIMPLTPMNAEGKAALSKVAMELETRGGTDIANAMRFTLKVADGRTHSSAPVHVVFMTDGEDETSKGYRPTTKHVVSTFGYGADHDSELLKHIPVNGGTYTFIDKAEKFGEIFGVFVADAKHMSATNVKMEFSPRAGFAITKVKGPGVRGHDNGTWGVDLPHVMTGHKKEFLVYADPIEQDVEEHIAKAPRVELTEHLLFGVTVHGSVGVGSTRQVGLDGIQVGVKIEEAPVVESVPVINTAINRTIVQVRW